MSIFRTLLLLSVALTATKSVFAETARRNISADTIIAELNAGKAIAYENVVVYGDLDLKRLTRRTNDSTYPENDRTVRVFSARIEQPVSFRNVVFTGKVDFFTRERLKIEDREYRAVFGKTVEFKDCKFRQKADFELTNFDADVSFAGTTFDHRPKFVRIGLVKIPDLTATIFKSGSEFKNFQDDAAQNLTAENLAEFYRNYLTKTE